VRRARRVSLVRGAWVPIGPLFLCLLLAPSLGAQWKMPGPDDPYFVVQTLRGTLDCGLALPGVAPPQNCHAPGLQTENEFKAPIGVNLTSALLEIRWVPVGVLAPDSLRVEFAEPLDQGGTTAWETGSGGRLWLQPIAEDVAKGAGGVALLVLPPQKAPRPSLVIDQPFEVALTFFHNGYRPSPEFTGFAEAPPGAAPEKPPPESPPADAPRPSPQAVQAAASYRGAGVLLGGLAIVGAASALAFTPRGRHLAWLAILPFFSRLDEDRVLGHPRRALLLSLVRAQPGIPVESARQRVGASNGVFEHHLRILVHRGLVRRAHVEGRVHLFPPGGPLSVPQERRSLAGRILEAVGAAPGQREVDLARRVGAAESTVRYHVRWLARRGRLRVVEDGRAVRCYPLE
jgi:DNA-binding transcriptional ArsR family regulator